MTVIHNHIDEKDKLTVLFIDLSKAFYIVDQKLLLQTINPYGLESLDNDFVEIIFVEMVSNC